MRVIDSSYMNRLMTKQTKWHVRPAKTQITLGIRPVWSESSLSAWRKLRSLATQWGHSEDSDQTGRMPRLIWVFAGRTGHFVGFVKMRLILRIFCHSGSIFFYTEWQNDWTKAGLSNLEADFQAGLCKLNFVSTIIKLKATRSISWMALYEIPSYFIIAHVQTD